jgi:Rrf2 family protein
LELAIRWHEGAVQAHDIAESQKIPLRFLHQILAGLKTAGIVTSRTGPTGGYELARPPAEISLGVVVRLLDGPLAPISCVSVNFYRECGCPDPEHCALRDAFREVRDAASRIMDETTFEQLRTRQAMLEFRSRPLLCGEEEVLSKADEPALDAALEPTQTRDTEV